MKKIIEKLIISVLIISFAFAMIGCEETPVNPDPTENPVDPNDPDDPDNPDSPWLFWILLMILLVVLVLIAKIISANRKKHRNPHRHKPFRGN